jgi:hypothetical protein
VTDADGGEEVIAAGSICAGNEFIQRQVLDILRKTRVP